MLEVEGRADTVPPDVFVRGQHLGGNDDTHRVHRSGQLSKLLRSQPVED